MNLPEAVSSKNVVLMNKAAVKLCANDFLGAKETLDELLESGGHQLVT